MGQILNDDAQLKRLDDVVSNFERANLYLRRREVDKAASLIQSISSEEIPKADYVRLHIDYGIALAHQASASEALDCFMRTKMDVLVIENCVIERNK